eukprot:1063480-Pyramimonas_sp.AAC.1
MVTIKGRNHELGTEFHLGCSTIVRRLRANAPFPVRYVFCTGNLCCREVGRNRLKPPNFLVMYGRALNSGDKAKEPASVSRPKRKHGACTPCAHGRVQHA